MSDLSARLAEELAASTTPAMSVAAERDGETLELVLGDVADSTVRFQAASITKTVTAEAVLSLVADRLISLDEDVSSLPGLPCVTGKAWRPRVTVRMLLSHQAGLIDDSGFPGYRVGAPLPTNGEILAGGEIVNSASFRVGVLPGAQLRYSGVGYQALQLLIEERTGEEFASVVQQRVFDPAGMTSACLAQPPPPGDPGFAIGHVDGAPIPDGWHVYPELAAAAMWCTPADLLALHRLVLRRPSAWLQREASSPAGSYGLGITLSPSGTIGHTGGNRGFVSWMVGSPDGRHRVGVMMNGEDRRLPLAAASIVATELGWDAIPMPPAGADDLVASILGTYADEAHTVSVTLDAELGLVMVFDDQPPIALSFVPPDLTAPGMAISMRIDNQPDGALLTLRQPGLKLELARR